MDNVKNISPLSYNTEMPDTPAIPVILLHVKQWGESVMIEYESVEAAIEAAVDMIAEGKGIPKNVSVNGAIVYKQADINTYWAEKYCE